MAKIGPRGRGKKKTVIAKSCADRLGAVADKGTVGELPSQNRRKKQSPRQTLPPNNGDSPALLPSRALPPIGGDDKELKGKSVDEIGSDEEDDDYVPGADPDEQDEDENDGGGGDEDVPAALSITKQKAVDDAFHELFGYHYSTPVSMNYAKSEYKIPMKCNNRILSKHLSILSSIFGKQSTLKLIRHSKYAAVLASPKLRSVGGMLRLEKRVITEVKRFAGHEIKVEKLVMVPVMAGEDDTTAQTTARAINSENNASSKSTNRNVKGVDSLLTELSRPERLSTISKTSADWDLFKSKKADGALKQQLESQAVGNEAYLVKKDFLDRVDHRRFELERAERDRGRARRGK